ncbi:dirigent protein 1-like [Miscanthus floridulus]|uniref:dirigent protein 1-like n=1 Tax=Miscanthus floridulus TaxID=154761 RepID=UPI0034583EDA
MAISISSSSVAASNKRLLLVAAVALALSASPSAVSARRRPVRLRLYMHDIVGGPGQTAVRLVKGPGPENPSMHPGNYFGDTVAVDDLLTEGLAVDSAPVGRAQGTYMTGSMRRPVFVVAVTLLLTAGPYNGSTLVVAGRDDTSLPVRELAVVGGTGALRRAAGHVLWSTARVESALHAVLLLDVHASVPAPSKAAAAAAESLVSSA